VLVSVPNVSEGARSDVITRIGAAFRPARLLNVHSDADHGRSVYTLAAPQGDLSRALLNGARRAVEEIDLRAHTGIHPHVGALDVVPVVYLDESRRGAACAEALTTAELLGDELGLPVFLYGDLATDASRRERAALRAGGPAGLRGRVRRGELAPDYGPRDINARSGAALVTARPPLVAFNIDLASDDVDLARAIAAELRESGGGFPGVRALGLHLPARGRAQVSMNVHDHRAAPLAEIVARVQARAPIAECELVGLAPAAAFEGFPGDVALRDFDARRDLLENALGSEPSHGTDQAQAQA
jgi:glutamate formiminotransferase/glutamate formiminotransferase/formiminotetrahydrofolate cyclodeaminase